MKKINAFTLTFLVYYLLNSGVVLAQEPFAQELPFNS
jgi:hypothetical protein